MFKKRSVQMKIVKDVDPRNVAPVKSAQYYNTIMRAAVQEMTKAGAILIVTYVASDAFRQAIVQTVNRK
jgi:hypothetical protein